MLAVITKRNFRKVNAINIQKKTAVSFDNFFMPVFNSRLGHTNASEFIPSFLLDLIKKKQRKAELTAWPSQELETSPAITTLVAV